MKHTINMTKCLLLFLFIICVGILALSVTFSEQDAIDSIKIAIPADNNTEITISLFSDNNRYYAFLPSFSNLEDMKIKNKSNYQIEFHEKKLIKKLLSQT